MSDLGNKDIMSKNILKYMEANHKTRNDMCDALGVKYTTFTDWVKGKTYPRIDKIELMANYFGILKSDLIEGSRPDIMEFTDDEIELIEHFRKADIGTQTAVRKLLDVREKESENVRAM